MHNNYFMCIPKQILLLLVYINKKKWEKPEKLSHILRASWIMQKLSLDPPCNMADIFDAALPASTVAATSHVGS